MDIDLVKWLEVEVKRLITRALEVGETGLIKLVRTSKERRPSSLPGSRNPSTYVTMATGVKDVVETELNLIIVLWSDRGGIFRAFRTMRYISKKKKKKKKPLPYNLLSNEQEHLFLTVDP